MGKSKFTGVPCFCNLCSRNNKLGYLIIPTRRRESHEQNDSKAYERRMAHEGPVQLKTLYKTSPSLVQDNNIVDSDEEMTDVLPPVSEEQTGVENDFLFFEEDDDEGEDFEEVLQNLDINLDTENGQDASAEDSTDGMFSSQERLNEDPSSYPTGPMSLLFVMLMHMLIGRYITDECAEIIMAFLNVALALFGDRYRFPAKLSTFKVKSRFDESTCSGLRTYVSCISCHSIYDLPGSMDERRRNMLCTFAKRVSAYGGRVLETCEEQLYVLKGNNTLIPRAYYMYNSVVETLKKFYMRNGFAEAVTAWKKRKLVHPEYMFDCYDANVFKNFKLHPSDTVPFVEESDHNLMFSFNVDWFQQFKNSTYSCGAMYLTCLNLPRSIRNRRENMIFVGLMPGGNGEAQLEQINHYLKPLIDELLLLKEGIQVKTPANNNGGFTDLLVKGACTLFVCDLPAASKAFGFSYFNSYYACRRCDYSFPRFKSSTKPNFSKKLIEAEMVKRTKQTNEKYATEHKSLTSHAARQLHVQQHGTRWSEFHRLPYADLVTFSVFDPMHNVWLGTCKRVVHHVFLERKLITAQHLQEMSNMCQNILLPPGFDSSSLIKKIALRTGFSFMKADEWRVFTIALSPLLLKGRVDTGFYDNWMIFVKCMQVMSLPGISYQEVNRCHSLIEEFVQGFVNLYGGKEMMSNMHYHFHLKEDMMNYGPWASHQCFNYERYNADLKGIRTNGRAGLERTLVKRMLNNIFRDDAGNSIPVTGDQKVDQRMLKLCKGKGSSDSVDPLLHEEIEKVKENENFSLLEFISFSGHLDGSGYTTAYGFEALPTNTISSLSLNKKKDSMKEEEYANLVEYYKFCFGDYFVDDKSVPFGIATNTYSAVNNQTTQFKSIQLLGQQYNSKRASTKKGNIVFAHYKDPTLTDLEHELRPAEVQFFFRHDVRLKDVHGAFGEYKFTFAYVRWFCDNDVNLSTYDTINTRTYANTFLPASHLSILPVHCINSAAGIYFNILDNYNIIFQLPRKIIE